MGNPCVGEDDSHVSLVVKWLMFIFNFFFWVIGGIFIGIGTWAYLEKKRFDYGKVGVEDGYEFYDVVFDLTIILMGMGILLFSIAFPGCLGALRENVLMLKGFMYILGGLLSIEVCLALLAFIFSDELKRKVTNLLQNKGIERYRDDPDLRNFVDYIQEKFQCCGVETSSYTSGFEAWNLNPYFNCSSANPSAERCAVPYSCCRHDENNIQDDLKNTMCGANVNVEGEEPDFIKLNKKIYTIGCVSAMVTKAKDNLFLMGGAALGFTIPQIIDLYIGYVMIRDIKLQAGMAA